MNLEAALPTPDAIVYPEDDGQPMSDNTKQFRWIVVLFGNLAALFHDRADVLVGGNLLWYPVEGRPELRAAPDVFVVFGRPRGDRRSYKQWEEGGVPFTVVFEILSPSNTFMEMDDKFVFYEEYGVEEYYVYDPETNRLMAFIRRGDILRRVRPVEGYVSPRLGIRFDLSGPEMVVYRPDGQRFLSFEELEALRTQALQQASQAELRAGQAEQRASQAEQRANQAEQRAARLVELGRKARQGVTTPEELQELTRLEEPSGGPSSV
jgi:Uma2 family endonuclease